MLFTQTVSDELTLWPRPSTMLVVRLAVFIVFLFSGLLISNYFSNAEVSVRVEGLQEAQRITVSKGQTAMELTLENYNVVSTYYPEWKATYIECIDSICETDTEWWTLWQEIDGQLIASEVGADLLELEAGAKMVWLLTGADEVPRH